MIVDTSAVIAILRDEPGAPELEAILERTLTCRISAANYFEAAIVIDRNLDPVLSRRLEAVLRDGEIIIETVTESQARIAREAYRDFGKGRHKAGLNFGDCFAYALAKEKGEPLLFKGDDFRHTDIEPAHPG